MSYKMISETRSIELNKKYLPIFDFFLKTHNLLLTNSEIDDIVSIVKQQEKENETIT